MTDERQKHIIEHITMLIDQARKDDEPITRIDFRITFSNNDESFIESTYGIDAEPS